MNDALRESTRLLCPAALSAVLLVASIAAQQEPAGSERQAAQHVPLGFNGGEELEYPANPALDHARGTLEFHVALGWQGDLGHDPCVLACGKKREAQAAGTGGARASHRYSVHFGADGGAVGMWNGRAWDDVPFDFEPGRYYHVALVTSGAKTAVVIDGEPVGILDLGYGNARGGKLFVGSSGDLEDPLVGSLVMFRIWNVALNADQLQVLRQLGDVPAELELADHLVAASKFTRRGNRVEYSRSAARGGPEPYRIDVDWRPDLEQASAIAQADGRLILSYVPGTGRSQLIANIERWLLTTQQWDEFSSDFVLHLDTAASRTLPGRFTVRDSRGRRLSTSMAWSMQGLRSMNRAAIELLQRSMWRHDDPEDADNMARIALLESAASLHELQAVRVPNGEQVTDATFDIAVALESRRQILELLREYRAQPRQRGAQPASQDPSAVVQGIWRQRAFELQAGWLDLPALDLETLEFGFLVAEHLVEADPETATEWVERIRPLATLDPVVDYRVADLQRRIGAAGR